jgi:hypothetical protein
MRREVVLHEVIQWGVDRIRHIVLVAESAKCDLVQDRQIRAWRDSLPD